MQTQDQAQGLQQLGAKVAQYDAPLPDILETFPNSHPDREYVTYHGSKEFTSRCPKTGQPDFAAYAIKYIGGKKMVESKSLKLYMQSWGGSKAPGAFMERICNEVLDALVLAVEPKAMVVEFAFAARGGVETSVRAVYVEPSANGFERNRLLGILG